MSARQAETRPRSLGPGVRKDVGVRVSPLARKTANAVHWITKLSQEVAPAMTADRSDERPGRPIIGIYTALAFHMVSLLDRGASETIDDVRAHILDETLFG